jgi:UDP-N-acetyl-D-glucosamine dehydrogenase
MNDHEDYKVQLLDALATRAAEVAVIGLGYVGLPLALTLVEAGYTVNAIDTDDAKVKSIGRGESYIPDVESAQLAGAVHDARLIATSDFSVLRRCRAISVCVPTPLRKTRDPDISYIVEATEKIAQHLNPGSVVVLESTTYPGTTSEIVLPLLTKGGLTIGESVFLAFSPERVDPANPVWKTRTIPKVMGGVTSACLEVALAYYAPAIETLVPVSSPEAAEMVKLLENTFRAVNIGLANEVLLMCDRLELDVWEVIDAAASKPFGFMKFTPGPGLGGHCIPIDPLYLAWRLKRSSYNPRFIELASEINAGMPQYWTRKIQDALNDAGLAVKGSSVLVLGVAYKRDVGDMRESPSLDIMEMLLAKGADVSYHDPYVPTLSEDGLTMSCVSDLESELAASDCVVIATDHSAYSPQLIAQHARLIVDTRRSPRIYDPPVQHLWSVTPSRVSEPEAREVARRATQ